MWYFMVSLSYVLLLRFQPNRPFQNNEEPSANRRMALFLFLIRLNPDLQMERGIYAFFLFIPSIEKSPDPKIK